MNLARFINDRLCVFSDQFRANPIIDSAAFLLAKVLKVYI